MSWRGDVQLLGCSSNKTLFSDGLFVQICKTEKLKSIDSLHHLDSDFKCNTSVLVVGTDSRIKHLAFRSQVFFLVGGSTHLELCVSPDH